MIQARQDVYDKVTTHLRLQGRPSLDGKDYSAYRGNEGRRCAIGIFITDAKYDPKIEGKSVETLMDYLPPEVAATGKGFLSDLQMLHDVGVKMVSGIFYNVSLESKLEHLAEKWELNYSKPSRG